MNCSFWWCAGCVIQTVSIRFINKDWSPQLSLAPQTQRTSKSAFGAPKWEATHQNQESTRSRQKVREEVDVVAVESEWIEQSRLGSGEEAK